MNVTDVTDVTHIHRGDMFTEKLTMHGDNRQFAARLKVGPAVIADGSEGVVVRHGKRIMVFTRDEALDLATRIVEVLEP